MKIDFIYFDVGGVLIENFPKSNKWNLMLKKLGLTESEIGSFNKIFDSEEINFCLGIKPLDSLNEVLRNTFNKTLPSGYSFLEDFNSYLEANLSLQNIACDLGKTYRTGLLTNMSLTMLDNIFQRGFLKKAEWDLIIDSSKVHMAKPNKDIYLYAQEIAKIEPANILLVENNLKNIQTAKSLGWNTFLYNYYNQAKSNQELLELLQ